MTMHESKHKPKSLEFLVLEAFLATGGNSYLQTSVMDANFRDIYRDCAPKLEGHCAVMKH